MSKNELMPVLNLITESYVSGLQNKGSIGDAWKDQFTVGAPSYSIGLQFEVPINHRAARTRHICRHHELRQLKNKYQTTIETLKLETRVAVREQQTSFNELASKRSALTATKMKADYIIRRWELLSGENKSGSYVLEDLLAAQAQLSKAEFEYLSAVVTYNLSLINHERATGTLLEHEQVSVHRTTINRLPTQIIHKPIVKEQPLRLPAPAPEPGASQSTIRPIQPISYQPNHRANMAQQRSVLLDNCFSTVRQILDGSTNCTTQCRQSFNRRTVGGYQ